MTPSSLSSGAKLTLPKDLRRLLIPLIDKARSTEQPLYLVGGLVRDLLLRKPALDVDVVVEGPADALARAAAKAYKAKLVAHPQFLTHTLEFSNGRHLDIATARTETYPESAALPVVEPASLQDDLFRRDFSINAIAVSLNDNDFGHVWDPFSGVEDLRAGRLRVLHSESFKDDPTRLFRAARFAGRFDYALDWRTREWLTEAVEKQLPSRLSGARLREELIPLMMEKDPRPAFGLLQRWSALAFLVPQLQWNKSHETLFGLALKSSARNPSDNLVPRLFSLFHELPVARATGAMGHMMFPQAVIETVSGALTLLHQAREGTLTAGSTKSLTRRPLSPLLKSLFEKAIKFKRGTNLSRNGESQWARVQDVAPCLSGRDIQNLGYKPGPLYSRIFDAIREARWEGKLRTREEEIRFVRTTFPPPQS